MRWTLALDSRAGSGSDGGRNGRGGTSNDTSSNTGRGRGGGRRGGGRGSSRSGGRSDGGDGGGTGASGSDGGTGRGTSDGLTDTAGVGSSNDGDLGRVLDDSLRVRDSDGDLLTGLCKRATVGLRQYCDSPECDLSICLLLTDVGVPNVDVAVLLTQVNQRNGGGVATGEDGQELHVEGNKKRWRGQQSNA